MAYLNRGIKISIIDKTGSKTKEFVNKYDGGIDEFVEFLDNKKEKLLNNNENELFKKSISITGKKGDTIVESSIRWNAGYSEEVLAFTNNIFQKDGGTHLLGFRSALTRVINRYAKDNKQITEFKEGMLPWSIQNPVALVFDEYDAGRPDVMFVIQRVLESDGSFTLLDKNKILKQNKFFRLFATTNTVGLGDTSGLYPGTQQINQGQMDRWNIVTTLNYLDLDKELEIVLAKNKNLNNAKGKEKVSNMIKVAGLTRKGFMAGDISSVMSPRTIIHWAENSEIFKDTGYAFRVTFLNKCDDLEKTIIAEYYQRCFGEDLPESTVNIKI